MAAIEIDPERMSGRPCIAGTRFPVSQMLAELAEGHSIKWFEREYGVDGKLVVAALNELALGIDHGIIKVTG